MNWLLTNPEIIDPAEIKRQHLVNISLWIVIAILAALANAGLHFSRLHVDYTLAKLYPNTKAMLILALAACFVRNHILFLALNLFLQTVCVLFVIQAWQYLGILADFPLVDTELAAADRWLGFSWDDYARLFLRYTWHGELLMRCYLSFKLLAVLTTISMIKSNRTGQGQRAVAAFIITAVIMIPVATVFPSLQPLDTYHVDETAFARTYVCAGDYKAIPMLLGMRDGSIKSVTWPAETALITFPSFHAAFAILFIYASLPFKYFRLISIPICVGMILATPGCGTHYLIDIVVAIPITLLAICLVRFLPYFRETAVDGKT